MNVKAMLDIDSALQHNLAQHTVFFWAYLNNCKATIGSGLYIQYRQKFYLLSAAHVFRGFCGNFSEVQIGFVDTPLTDVSRGVIAFPSNRNIPEEIDYALFEIGENIRADLKEIGLCPYPVKDYSSGWGMPFDDTMHYFIFGYPATRNDHKNKQFSKNKDFRAWYYTLHLPLIIDKYFVEGSILSFAYVQNALVKTEDWESKRKTTGVDPHGMSGCGIWFSPFYPCVNLVKSYHLVGMLHQIDPERKCVYGLNLQDICTNIKLMREKLETIPLSAKQRILCSYPSDEKSVP